MDAAELDWNRTLREQGALRLPEPGMLRDRCLPTKPATNGATR
jgi:hypothetical protein